MLAKLTLAGLDRWAKSGQYTGSQDMWDLLRVPDGADRDLLINAILYRSFEYPVQYMQLERVREQIGLVSDMYQMEMQRTWDALNAEYNPIHNFDRMEDYTDTETGESTATDKGSSTSSGKADSTDTGKQTVTGETSSTGSTSTKADGTSSTSNTQEQSYMGDTASSYSPAQKTTNTGSGTTSDTGSSSTTDSGSSKTATDDTRTSTGTTSGTTSDTREQTGNSSRKLQHTAHLYGNIGVTTSQQMLDAELVLRMTKNWYDLWAGKFTNELCVGIF